MRLPLVLGVALVISLRGSTLAATIGGIFNTGLDELGRPLPSGLFDAHWQVSKGISRNRAATGPGASPTPPPGGAVPPDSGGGPTVPGASTNPGPTNPGVPMNPGGVPGVTPPMSGMPGPTGGGTTGGPVTSPGPPSPTSPTGPGSSPGLSPPPPLSGDTARMVVGPTYQSSTLLAEDPTLVFSSPKFAPFMVSTSGGDRASSWLPGNPTSQWISYSGLAGALANDAIYRYDLPFSLIGLNPATGVLQGRFASAGGRAQIYLNGRFTGDQIGDGSATQNVWREFSISERDGDVFLAENNVLTIYVDNIVNLPTGPPNPGVMISDSNPSALRVEFTLASAGAIPEPATVTLLLFALCAPLARRFR